MSHKKKIKVILEVTALLSFVGLPTLMDTSTHRRKCLSSIHGFGIPAIPYKECILFFRKNKS
jgi:hypothetical protein